MSALTLNGKDVLRARITMPKRGAWVASVVVDTQVALQGTVTLASFDGAFTITGTVERGDVADDAFHAHLVGGAGGLEQVVPPQSYRFVPARTAFADALAAAGERLSDASDEALLATTLPYWTREAMPCAAALARLASVLDASWRVLPDGSVWVGRDAWPAAPAFACDVLEESPSEGRQVLGVEAPRLLAGVTFGGKRASLVVHTVGEGKARTEVWYERPDLDGGRSFEGLRRWLAKALVRMDTLALYPARVVSQSDDGSLDVKPDSDRLPGLSRVPIRAGLPGVLVRVESGARVLIAFEEGDPRRPVATLWESTQLRDLRVGGERGVARVADSVVVPIPKGYTLKAAITLVGAGLGAGSYPESTIVVGLLPNPPPDALSGTIVTGSNLLKA